MEEVPLPTVLSLPAVSSNPSVKCLQLSQDGQLVILTKNAVYILTPALGIAVEPSAVIQQVSEFKSPSHITRPLGWLRTMVEFDRSLVHHWPTDSSEWASVSLGSLDPSLHAVALSPSNLTAEAGCVLALLNSNLELTIWSASKNFLTGHWHKLQDVTLSLKTATAAKDTATALEVLRAQSICIEWSSQPDWNTSPSPLVDASLLAVGNRAGFVTFLRFVEIAREVVAVAEISVSDRWVTHVAWSSWKVSHDGVCEAMLSCAASDGSVVLVRVRQTLQSNPSHSRLSSDHELGLSVQNHDEIVSEADGRKITGMRWMNIHGHNPILIYHKPGVVHLWSSTLSEAGWSGSRSFVLQTYKRSVGSSALSPASGICLIPGQDLAVISLSDGSFHVIHNLSSEPRLDSPMSASPRSDSLSTVSRSVFVKAEQEPVTFKDVDRVNGADSIDGASTFIWTYEPTRPTDFSYKHDARHISTLVVAPLWDERDEDIDERAVNELAECIGRPRNATGEAPLSILRPIFWHLRDANRTSRLSSRVLDLLLQSLPHDSIGDIVTGTHIAQWTPEVSRDLKKSLAMHMFGGIRIQSLRLRYAISAFCQIHAETPDVQHKYAEAASLFLADIRVHMQMVLIRHLSAIAELLTRSDDIFFARRTVRQAATTPGVPSALAQEIEELSERLPPAPHPDAGSHLDGRDNLDEHCPACNAAIPLQSPEAESAICANGHVWARCCITSLILATPNVRTCISCSRKAFIPPVAAAAPPCGDNLGDSDNFGTVQAAPTVQPPKQLPADGLRGFSRGKGFVQDLLDAVRRCPYCGNNFVVLV